LPKQQPKAKKPSSERQKNSATSKRKAREKELAAKIEALPDKKYGVILADPEWKFEPFSDRGRMNSAPDS
jgi:hypothetical protein